MVDIDQKTIDFMAHNQNFTRHPNLALVYYHLCELDPNLLGRFRYFGCFLKESIKSNGLGRRFYLGMADLMASAILGVLSNLPAVS
jgi:hypothetical protein